MAELPEGQAIVGSRLAERTSIPGNYLSKMLVVLRNVGLVRTARGQGGGYQLAKPADQIALIEVVKLFEGIDCEPQCLLGEDHDCCDEFACGAHERWKHVVQVYTQFLRTTVIADLSNPQGSKDG